MSEELTVALSRTFTESSSATLCFRRASSRVQRGRFSHFPNTTRSMSLSTEHTHKSCLKKKLYSFSLTLRLPDFKLVQWKPISHTARWRPNVLVVAALGGLVTLTTIFCWSFHRSQASGNGGFERSKTSKNTSEHFLFIKASGTRKPETCPYAWDELTLIQVIKCEKLSCKQCMWDAIIWMKKEENTHAFPFICIERSWKDVWETGTRDSSKEQGTQVGFALFMVIIAVPFQSELWEGTTYSENSIKIFRVTQGFADT